MFRSVVLVLSGTVVGSMAVWFLFAHKNLPTSESSLQKVELAEAAEDPPVPAPENMLRPGAETFDILDPVDPARPSSTRIAVYQHAAQTSDPRELEFVIQSVAAEPRSRGREMRLEALLSRLAEIDPGRAAQFAESLFVDLQLLKPLFQAWALADADAAIRALAAIRSPYQQRELAVGLLDVLGSDPDTLARVAAALPESAAVSLEAESIVARAETDPAGALAAMLEIDDTRMMSWVMSGIAGAVVQHDPEAALALADDMTDPEKRSAYTRALLTAWSAADADATFTYLETRPPSELADLPVASVLTRAQPERMLALSDRLPPTEAMQVRYMAIRYIAEQDPGAALSYLESMAPGQERDSVLQSIAQAYARSDPDAALAWVTGLTPPSEQAMRSVIQGISSVDFDRGVDLLIAELEKPSTGAVSIFGTLFGLPLSTGSAQNTSRLLDRLLQVEANNTQVQSALRTTMSQWAQRDPQEALNWFHANASRIPASAMSDFALNLARDDPQTAMQALASLGYEQRNAWIPGIASGMAENDPAAALRFLEQYRGQPSYSEGVGNVLERWARSDPAGAAGMLSEAPEQTQSMVSQRIAMQWVRTEPEAAARWVATLGNERTGEQAAIAVATGWGQSDPEAASRWALALDPGAARDASLTGLLAVGARTGSIDARLVDAFSSDQARDQGLRNAIVQIALRDPAEGRRMLDAHVDDPRLRNEIETAIESTSSQIAVSGILIQ